MSRHFAGALALALSCASTCLLLPAPALQAQGSGDDPGHSAASLASGIPGQRVVTVAGVAERNDAIAGRQAAAPPRSPHPEHELEYPDRHNLPDNPAAMPVSRFPSGGRSESFIHSTEYIHTTNVAFDGATLSDTLAFPPDSMGTIGPTQYVVFVNGRIRSFTRAGTADGVMNFDPDVFFASIMTPVGGSILLNFTSDPQIRYDRFTGRWYLSIIDVPCTTANCSATAANRWLLAVSDAASNGTITNTTVWTFLYFQADATNFCDYPSLGIDVNALYVGCNMFGASFAGTNGYVVQKTSTLGAGPLVVTKFANLATSTGAGPYTPRGVDNFDSNATEGYFVGVDNASFSLVVFRRITNPGSATPTISSNISVTVPTTRYPNPIDHAGNTGGSNGRLDSLDDRLFQAMVRNGRLWTAHNILTTNAGVATTSTTTGRNSTRWYEFQNLTGTPALVESGTVYDSASTRAAALHYWIPSVTVTGQGHAVIGMSLAGTPQGATPGYVGRLSGDTLGTMTGPPSAGAVQFGTTTANYNPPSDPGGGSGRRWGDYSFTVVDPLDDMSVWTIQEYNQAQNSYAVRVARLLAPPPATPTCSGSPIAFSGPAGNVAIAATSSNGSGFYDPGTDLPPPAVAFNHITATVTNATVNSVTYNSPTQVTLNITATTAGLQDVTITNPDGQQVTATGCIDVQAVAAQLAFTVQPPASTPVGASFVATVSVEDSGGSVVTGDSSAVTVELTAPGGATLGGTTTLNAVSGVAAFNGLTVDTAGTYTLTATDGGLTSTQSMSFTISKADQTITFTSSPPDDAYIAGSTYAVTAIGGASTQPIVFTIDAASSGVCAIAGSTVSFIGEGDCTIDANQAGDANYNPAPQVQQTFAVTLGPATQLVFTVQPANLLAGTATSVDVSVESAAGIVESGDGATQITLSIGACGGTSLGAQTVSAGVAHFAGLPPFYTVANGLQLHAQSNTGLNGDSATFDVLPNANLVFADGFDDCRL